jgi:hypothetical protein
MNTTTTTATENLAQQVQQIALLVEDEMTLRRRIDAAKKVIHEFNNARLEFEAAKGARREILGTIHLSGKADSGKKNLTLADTALRSAEVRCEGLSDHASGASFALERLSIDAKATHDRVAELRNQLPAMQYAAACEQSESIIAAYVEAGENFATAFSSVCGALQTLEQMRNSDKAPFTFHPLYPMGLEMPDLPYLQQFGFRAYRSHTEVAEMAQAQRKIFTERLSGLGIL